MKFMDDKGRFFGKFSIVDLFVILLIIACVGAVGLKLKASKAVTGGDRTITYEMLVKNIRDVSLNAINKNHVGLIDAESKKAVGNIQSVTADNAKVLLQLENGEYVITEYDNRYDTTIIIGVTGTETEDGYFTETGRQLVVGETIKVNNGQAEFFGEVISVKAE